MNGEDILFPNIYLHYSKALGKDITVLSKVIPQDEHWNQLNGFISMFNQLLICTRVSDANFSKYLASFENDKMVEEFQSLSIQYSSFIASMCYQQGKLLVFEDVNKLWITVLRDFFIEQLRESLIFLDSSLQDDEARYQRFGQLELPIQKNILRNSFQKACQKIPEVQWMNVDRFVFDSPYVSKTSEMSALYSNIPFIIILAMILCLSKFPQVDSSSLSFVGFMHLTEKAVKEFLLLFFAGFKGDQNGSSIVNNITQILEYETNQLFSTNIEIVRSSSDDIDLNEIRTIEAALNDHSDEDQSKETEERSWLSGRGSSLLVRLCVMKVWSEKFEQGEKYDESKLFNEWLQEGIDLFNQNSSYWKAKIQSITPLLFPSIQQTAKRSWKEFIRNVAKNFVVQPNTPKGDWRDEFIKKPYLKHRKNWENYYSCIIDQASRQVESYHHPKKHNLDKEKDLDSPSNKKIKQEESSDTNDIIELSKRVDLLCNRIEESNHLLANFVSHTHQVLQTIQPAMYPSIFHSNYDTNKDNDQTRQQPQHYVPTINAPQNPANKKN